jgi:uncharacterized membrane-anchored protein YhcB (DUF1043 family)
MSAKWVWYIGIATLSAAVLAVLFFIFSTTMTFREWIGILIGIAIGATLAALVANHLWHKKPKLAVPLNPGQFTDVKRAEELKDKIDSWERELIDADDKVQELTDTEHTSYGAFRKNFSPDDQKRATARLKKAKLRSKQLKENIEDARRQREGLRVPTPKPIRISAPKGQIPRRGSTGR